MIQFAPSKLLKQGIKMRTVYTTEGDISAKKQKDAYPKLALCDNCVRDYVVIAQGERTYKPCAKCGADD